ncbi:MAG: YfhO family protein, partial [Anaerolineales bacterium]
IPTFALFQAPTRLSIIAIFCLTLLAAIGADTWRRPGERGKYWLRLGVMAAAAITIGAGVALIVSRTFDWGIRPSFIRSTALLGFWGVGLGVLALKAPERDNSKFTAGKWGWWQWAVVLWVAADLIVAGWGLNPGVDLSVYSDPSPAADEVKSMLDGGRLYLPSEDEKQLKFERFFVFDTFQPFDEGEDWGSLRATLLPNATILDAIPSANNFDPLIPGRYANWIDVLQVADLESKEQMLNLMGVEVVERIDSTQENGVRFDGRESFPRYRWVPCGLAVETGTEALEMIQHRQVNFQREVILELDDPISNLTCDNDIRVDISVKSQFANKSVLAVTSPNPGYLIMADVWYPGWQSFVDGIPTPVLKANYLFRAITLPAGEHIVTFAYQPKWFYTGALVSGVSLIVLIVLSFYWFRTKKTAIRN